MSDSEERDDKLYPGAGREGEEGGSEWNTLPCGCVKIYDRNPDGTATLSGVKRNPECDLEH